MVDFVEGDYVKATSGRNVLYGKLYNIGGYIVSLTAESTTDTIEVDPDEWTIEAAKPPIVLPTKLNAVVFKKGSYDSDGYYYWLRSGYGELHWTDNEGDSYPVDEMQGMAETAERFEVIFAGGEVA